MIWKIYLLGIGRTSFCAIKYAKNDHKMEAIHPRFHIFWYFSFYGNNVNITFNNWWRNDFNLIESKASLNFNDLPSFFVPPLPRFSLTSCFFINVQWNKIIQLMYFIFLSNILEQMKEIYIILINRIFFLEIYGDSVICKQSF